MIPVNLWHDPGIFCPTTGVIGRPAFPAPSLLEGRNILQNPGEMRRGNVERDAAISRHEKNEGAARPSREGAGNAGCLVHPWFGQKMPGVVPQVHRNHPGIPCAMALRLTSCSPWRPGFLATITRGSSCFSRA